MSNKSRKKILFITTTNIAVNPRLVKELDLACRLGFDCSVIQFRLGNWSDAMTDQLKFEFSSVKFICLSALRRPFFPWILSTILERISRMFPVFFLRGFFLSAAVDKRTLLLLNTIRNVDQVYHWVIAHNPGAFYPAMLLSKRSGAYLGIDVEDFHPGESNHKKMQNILLNMMQMTLPSARYCSYASPLIKKEVQKQIGNLPANQFVVLNSFPRKEFLQPVADKTHILKLVWFSQNITKGRGLEMIIPLIKKYSSRIELHLIGALNSEFKTKYIKEQAGIFIHEPMPQPALHKYLAQFDVGLATDIPINYNRDIALTNKIIAYAQAGLFIAAMHTSAQDLFLKESGLQFLQMHNTESSIIQTLDQLLDLKQKGLINKVLQYSMGAEFCWENISHSLKETWSIEN